MKHRGIILPLQNKYVMENKEGLEKFLRCVCEYMTQFAVNHFVNFISRLLYLKQRKKRKVTVNNLEKSNERLSPPHLWLSIL